MNIIATYAPRLHRHVATSPEPDDLLVEELDGLVIASFEFPDDFLDDLNQAIFELTAITPPQGFEFEWTYIPFPGSDDAKDWTDDHKEVLPLMWFQQWGCLSAKGTADAHAWLGEYALALEVPCFAHVTTLRGLINLAVCRDGGLVIA